MSGKFLLNPKIVLPVLVILGFVLRIIPIKYGLPLQINIDEPSLVSAVFSLKHNINPERFDWPHLFFYINFLGYGAVYYVGKLLGFAFETDAIYFMTSRFISILFGVATIPVIYLITKELFGSVRKALIAALILTFLPVHVYESFFAKLDVSHTFFVAVAVYLMARILKAPLLKNYIWAGVFIGLSVSVKYNSFLLVLPFLIAHIAAQNSYKDLVKSKNILNPIISGVVAIFAFLLGTPFALLDFKTFWSYEPRVGVLWQFTNVGNVEPGLYLQSATETFTSMYREDLGIFIWLALLYILFMYLFFSRRSKQLTFLILPVILISLYISKLDRSPSHYFLFLAPLYIPAIADLIVNLYKKLIERKPKLHVLGIPLLILFIAPSVYLSIKTVYIYSQPDTRLEAYNWVQENLIPRKNFIYVAGDNIETISFDDKNSERVKRVDYDVINEKSYPVFFILAYEGLTPEKLQSSDWDIENISGNSKELLSHSQILKYIPSGVRAGPPIIIFEVPENIYTND